MSQNINEWLSCNLFERGHVSCHKVIRIIVVYTLSITLFVTAALCYVIEIEPHPSYTTVGHLNVGSVGRLIPTMGHKMPGKGSYLIMLSRHNLISISPGMLPNRSVRECMFDSSPANHFGNP